MLVFGMGGAGKYLHLSLSLSLSLCLVLFSTVVSGLEKQLQAYYLPYLETLKSLVAPSLCLGRYSQGRYSQVLISVS